MTTLLDGGRGDTSRMDGTGDVPINLRQLVDATYEARMAGIAQVKPGAHASFEPIVLAFLRPNC